MLLSKPTAVHDKIASGTTGFDDITGGGLPRGRTTVVLGGAGCGKTIFALQALVAGARQGEPGLFVTFEESPQYVQKDARRFSWGLTEWGDSGVDFIDARLSLAIIQGGEFDLLGLLAMVGAKAKAMGATLIVFDGLDVLLSHLGDPLLIRREIFRLREWIDLTGLTGIITAKANADDGALSPDYDFLQFIADCVVSLHHRVRKGVAARLLRVAKYRGGAHSANEFSFTITQAGIEFGVGTMPEMQHSVSVARVTSGIERLDLMLGGGYYRGSSVLISGSPGTSKTSLAAAFAEAACRRGEATVYISFDEAPEQIIRNVASIGIDFATPIAAGTLTMCSLRARSDTPESHVARICSLLARHHAHNLVVDPISALAQMSDESVSDRAAVQLLDWAKHRGITTFSTSLLATGAPMSEETPIGVSTIADTWMHVSYIINAGERNRALTIIKSRGTSHSNQVRELILTSAGIGLADPYIVGGEVLMGTLRWERENEDRRAKLASLAEADLNQKRAELALAQARVRVEASRSEQVMREADLQRILRVRHAVLEVERNDTAELTMLRGGEEVSEVVAPAPKRVDS